MKKEKLFLLIIMSFVVFHFSIVNAYSNESAIEDLVFNAMVVGLNTTEEQLLSKFGKPQRVEKKSFENPHYAFLDESIQYYYIGLEITYYHHKHPESGWKAIREISISTNDYKLKYNIKIGMHLSDIKLFLGTTNQFFIDLEGNTYYTYEAQDSVHHQITFVFKNDKLIRIIWSNWP